MKKLIAAIAATAVAASLAMTATFASADVYYTIPTDPASWGTWMLGSPKLDETDQLYAEETAEGDLAVIHFAEKIVEDVCQLFLGVRNLDIEKAGAVEQTVHVLVQTEDHTVSRHGGLVNAVSKIAGAVVHGDGHLLQRSADAVVIT